LALYGQVNPKSSQEIDRSADSENPRVYHFNLYFNHSSMHTPIDQLLMAADEALRVVFASHRSNRPNPSHQVNDIELSSEERALSGALMRVNHVGEVCAQALYSGQALATQDPKLVAQFKEAGSEERDHLAWTHERIKDLDTHTSYLNPLWYAGAFALGYTVGKIGKDSVSLGFVMETEKQVEAHLATHMERLPHADLKSRAIVQHMKIDEAKHARDAMRSGGVDLPTPFKAMMKWSAKLMTTLAHRI
jgi:3-demethoxyubiquinol 3-hydroxylase